MRKPFTDDGPNQPLSLIIDCDDPFANRDSIGEGYNSGAGFELCVNNKTWHQSGVQSANVLDRRPDLIRLCRGCNLFSYSSHTPSHSDAANRVSSPNRTIATRQSRQALAKLVLILASWLLNIHYGLAWVLGEKIAVAYAAWRKQRGLLFCCTAV